MGMYIGDIAEQVPFISPNEISRTVDEIFTNNTKLHGVVVVEDEKPIWLVTKTDFYQKIGNMYGYNLYMGRSIELVANKKPLIVDYFESITTVSKAAMQRKEEDRYDFVIVTREDKYVGIVSIEKLLMKLVEVQTELASYLNPLTRLPGNYSIEKGLNDIIKKESFSVLYIDLDNFKAYNDTYGFKKGDELLLAIAKLLKKVCKQFQCFLGHIGGDDFIIMMEHYDYQPICSKIIDEFNDIIKQFYVEKHLLQQYVIAENRQGVKEKTMLVSLSIAIVTNKSRDFNDMDELTEYMAIVKSHCKKIKGSCYLEYKDIG